jgi:hypothetical protein
MREGSQIAHLVHAHTYVNHVFIDTTLLDLVVSVFRFLDTLASANRSTHSPLIRKGYGQLGLAIVR